MQSTTSSTRTFKAPPSGTPTPKAPRRIKLSKRALWLMIAALVVICGLLFVQYRRAQHKLSDSGQKFITSNQQQLSKLILLPHNETPRVATVKDPTKLQQQSFYADARSGDIVFIYPKAGKAILYRPSGHIIVNVASGTTTQ